MTLNGVPRIPNGWLVFINIHAKNLFCAGCAIYRQTHLPHSSLRAIFVPIVRHPDTCRKRPLRPKPMTPIGMNNKWWQLRMVKPTMCRPRKSFCVKCLPNSHVWQRETPERMNWRSNRNWWNRSRDSLFRYFAGTHSRYDMSSCQSRCHIAVDSHRIRCIYVLWENVRRRQWCDSASGRPRNGHSFSNIPNENERSGSRMQFWCNAPMYTSRAIVAYTASTPKINNRIDASAKYDLR